AHQSLLGVEAQREALDVFGKVDLSDLAHAREVVAEIDAALAELGGDERARARELDLVRYQVGELVEADLQDADEDERLAERQELLANASAHQEAAGNALEILIEDGGARDRLSQGLTLIEGPGPFEEPAGRISNLLADLDDIADQVRSVGDGIEDDPEELEHVLARRRMLRELCRKYGDDLTAVMGERDALQLRLKELEDHDVLAADLDRRRQEAAAALEAANAAVRQARQAAAPELAKAIEANLPDLAMPRARVGIEAVGEDGGEVSFQLAANPGSDLQPLAKVASGGELARAMLALRSVLSEAPPVLVFDEVDAGIGGQAGFAVGRSLTDLGDRHQVLVVTHLPQVAVFADAHLAVEKKQGTEETISEIHFLDADGRLTELARMLSGQPDSAT
ncbi:MAG: hypothetical protein AAFO29_24685, partial [Actinomycetota bacterium]